MTCQYPQYSARYAYNRGCRCDRCREASRVRPPVEQHKYVIVCPFCGRCRAVQYDAYRKFRKGRVRGYCGPTCANADRRGDDPPARRPGDLLTRREIREWAEEKLSAMTLLERERLVQDFSLMAEYLGIDLKAAA